MSNTSNELPAPVDLSSLDPTRDAARFDGIVRSITSDAMALRAQRREGGRSAFAPVVAWTKPMLAAAAVVLVIAGSALVLMPARASAGPVSLAESAGVPASLFDLATNHRSVSAAELVDVFDAMSITGAGRQWQR